MNATGHKQHATQDTGHILKDTRTHTSDKTNASGHMLQDTCDRKHATSHTLQYIRDRKHATGLTVPDRSNKTQWTGHTRQVKHYKTQDRKNVTGPKLQETCYWATSAVGQSACLATQRSWVRTQPRPDAHYVPSFPTVGNLK